ncbi:hypothetical protein ABN028_28840 [Actinopolymorpha sp. B17G11]|uniref:hypothetical protein n=1 Tax=unclassified Actinopolymorpha TaxID=2627063 RepID=UPI0032D983C5
MNVGRVWKGSPGPLLVAYVMLDLLLLIYTRTVGADVNEGNPVAEQVFWALVSAGLTWLVWRRSRLAWGIQVVLSAWMLAVLALGADIVNAYLVTLLVVIATQMTALLSPAVRKHVRTTRMPDSSPESGQA